MRFHPPAQQKRYGFLPGSIKRLIAIVLVLLLLVFSVLSLTARGSLYKAYAYPRIWVSSTYKAWVSFPIEDGFYVGMQDLLEKDGNTGNGQTQPIEPSSLSLDNSTTVLSEEREGPVPVACDGIKNVELRSSAVSLLKAFNGSLSRFPEPSLGSYDVLGLEWDQFFTRDTRFSQYGLDEDDASTSSFKWNEIDWADIQTKCVARNQALFLRPRPALNVSTPENEQHELGQGEDTNRSHPESAYPDPSKKPRPRTAIVMRAWDDFQWTKDALHNIRAMISELSLFSAGEYQLYIILQIRNLSEQLLAENKTYEDIKQRYVPKELLNMTELWNETDCQIAYPKVKEYDYYYQSFMPLQLFAIKHPEFEFYWNWEMDVRYTGHYHQLLEHLASWAKSQTRNYLWDRNARFYIPAIHGSYDKFEKAIAASATDPPWGPVKPLLPRVDFPEHPDAAWGVGEEADLITLFPMFNPKGTIWPHRDHLINYDAVSAAKPRRSSVITLMRFSRRLLMTMHDENSHAGRSMASEMWAPTTALHHGLKAVYAPHPVFLDRRWPPHMLQRIFNAGPGGEVGGSLNTVINQEHNWRGATWFWNAQFSRNLYQRWMGKVSSGPGSPEWEKEHGQMCLPGILLHPIKTAELDP